MTTSNPLDSTTTSNDLYSFIVLVDGGFKYVYEAVDLTEQATSLILSASTVSVFSILSIGDSKASE